MKKSLNSGFSNMINERANEALTSLGIKHKVVEIPCKDIDTWEYRDRKDFELGNINDLADSILTRGQAQPIIVVEASKSFKQKSNKESKYIVIAGYRRWLACKSINIPVQAIVATLSVQEAISTLIAENEKEPVSDYSTGMFYHEILKKEKITQDELHKKLNIPITTLKRYLSFARVPQDVWNEVGDLSKVSFRSAAEIASICAKGEEHIAAVIRIADKIRRGYGEKRLRKAIEDDIKGYKRKDNLGTEKKYEGMVVMSVKESHIRFPKHVYKHENFELLVDEIENLVKSMIFQEK